MKKDQFLDIICLGCKHLDTMRIGGCKAFPGEIPKAILLGQTAHIHPIKGQEGDYVYHPIEEPMKIWKRIDRASHLARRTEKNFRAEKWQ